jgi:hypothetical protein
MGFESNKELASKNGKKSKRGEAKLTKDVKEMVKELTEQLYSDVTSNIKELDTNQKAQLLVKLIDYQLPKLKAIENKTDNTGNIIIDLGGGLTEPIINKNETPFERIRRVNNLEPEKKEAYDRLTTTGELLPSDFTHGIKFTSTPKEVDQDKPEPKKVLKITEDIKPIEDIKPKVKKVSKYIVM